MAVHIEKTTCPLHLFLDDNGGRVLVEALIAAVATTKWLGSEQILRGDQGSSSLNGNHCAELQTSEAVDIFDLNFSVCYFRIRPSGGCIQRIDKILGNSANRETEK